MARMNDGIRSRSMSVVSSQSQPVQQIPQRVQNQQPISGNNNNNSATGSIAAVISDINDNNDAPMREADQPNVAIIDNSGDVQMDENQQQQQASNPTDNQNQGADDDGDQQMENEQGSDNIPPNIQLPAQAINNQEVQPIPNPPPANPAPTEIKEEKEEKKAQPSHDKTECMICWEPFDESIPRFSRTICPFCGNFHVHHRCWFRSVQSTQERTGIWTAPCCRSEVPIDREHRLYRTPPIDYDVDEFRTFDVASVMYGDHDDERPLTEEEDSELEDGEIKEEEQEQQRQQNENNNHNRNQRKIGRAHV